ncbi:hypothetical protein LTR95_012143 [Oleoguttula sp. CCFEE 5521]
MHGLTLRALAAQCFLSLLTTSQLAHAESDSTVVITSTAVRTIWVVITSNSNTITTYSTATLVDGSTLGISTLIGSTVTGAATSFPTAPAMSGDMSWQGQAFQDAVLNSTNYFRAQHLANPVTWSDKLAEYAGTHAEKCVFEHSGGSSGENLAVGYNSPTISIDAWANEESSYNYQARKFSEKSGHYTQLVWKNTTAVGCGAIKCSNSASNGANGWYLVCEYDPPGNVAGQFGGNVGKVGQGKDGEPGFAAKGSRLWSGGAAVVALVVSAVVMQAVM